MEYSVNPVKLKNNANVTKIRESQKKKKYKKQTFAIKNNVQNDL